MSIADPVIDHIDPALKRIFLKAGVTSYHPVADIYPEIRQLRQLNESLRWFDMPVTAAGNIPKGGGKFTSRYAVFCHGWKVVPQDVTHALYVTGEQITDDGQSGPACLDTLSLSPGTNVTIHYEPPASELVRADAEIAAIAKTSYSGKVVLDKVNGIAGTALGIGTQANPVNNVADLRTIATEYGIGVIQLAPGTYNFGTGENLSGFIVRGEHAIRTMVTIVPDANVANTQLEDLFLINSMLDGYTYVKHCSVAYGLAGFNGFMETSMIAGQVTLANASASYFVDCKSGCVGLGSNDLPVLDMGVGNLNVAFRNWSGPIKIINCADPDNTICIDIVSGATIILDASCADASAIYIRGIGNIVNLSSIPQSKIHHEAHIDGSEIATAVWNSQISVTPVPGSFGDWVSKKLLTVPKFLGLK